MSRSLKAAGVEVRSSSRTSTSTRNPRPTPGHPHSTLKSRITRPHEVGGGRTVRLHWFHAGIHVLHGRACFPRRSHLRLDDQRAAQSPCLAILVPLGMRCLINNKLHRGSGGWPHPLSAFYRPRPRSAAPVMSRCTRSVAMHPIRRGVMPTDRVHHLIDNKLARGFSPWRRRRRSPTGPGRAALHQIQQQCTR